MGVCAFVGVSACVWVCVHVCGCVCVCMCVSMGVCHLWVLLEGVLEFSVFTMVGHFFSPINISLCNKQGKGKKS